MMSVNPGFGGQKFIENTYHKIAELKELILSKNSKALIEIDGGVATGNALKLVQTGADVLVAGNTVFTAPDPKGMVQELKKITSADTISA
jgi:ribulose-phosphate 3-epimerase